MPKSTGFIRIAAALMALSFATYATAQPQNMGPCSAANLNEAAFNAIKVGQSFAEVMAIVKCQPMSGYRQGEYFTRIIDSQGQRFTMVNWQNMADGMGNMRTIRVRFNKDATVVTADRNGDFKEGNGF